MSTEKSVIKFSKETIELLKNFCDINASMAFVKGNTIRTVAQSQHALAEATIPETIPQDFSIYELAKFLGVFSIPTMADAELHFDGDEKVSIISGPTRLNYRFTQADFARPPEKTIVITEPDVSFTMTKDMLESFVKVCKAFNHTMMVVRVQDGKATLSLENPQISDSNNDYVVDIGDVPGSIDGAYFLRMENLTALPGDYDVVVGKQGRVIRFKNKDRDLTYFFALEQIKNTNQDDDE